LVRPRILDCQWRGPVAAEIPQQGGIDRGWPFNVVSLLRPGGLPAATQSVAGGAKAKGGASRSRFGLRGPSREELLPLELDGSLRPLRPQKPKTTRGQRVALRLRANPGPGGG